MRTLQDYQDALRTQLKFLKNSCDLYDKGETTEALRSILNFSINRCCLISLRIVSVHSLQYFVSVVAVGEVW